MRAMYNALQVLHFYWMNECARGCLLYSYHFYIHHPSILMSAGIQIRANVEDPDSILFPELSQCHALTQSTAGPSSLD